MARYASDFTAATTLNSSDIAQIVQLGVDRKMSMGTLLTYINNNSTAFVTNSAFSTFQSGYNSHASSHILGGTNELDAMKTRVTNLTITTTPSASWTGSGNAAHLGAYLYAIDYRINSNETTLNDHSARHAENGADELAGLYLDATGFSPVIYTPVTWGIGTTTTSIGAHFAGIDSVLGGYSSQFTAISAQFDAVGSEIDGVVSDFNTDITSLSGAIDTINAKSFGQFYSGSNTIAAFGTADTYEKLTIGNNGETSNVTGNTTYFTVGTTGYYSVRYTATVLPSGGTDNITLAVLIDDIEKPVSISKILGTTATVTGEYIGLLSATTTEVAIGIKNATDTSGATIQNASVTIQKIV